MSPHYSPSSRRCRPYMWILGRSKRGWWKFNGGAESPISAHQVLSHLQWTQSLGPSRCKAPWIFQKWYRWLPRGYSRLTHPFWNCQSLGQIGPTCHLRGTLATLMSWVWSPGSFCSRILTYYRLRSWEESRLNWEDCASHVRPLLWKANTIYSPSQSADSARAPSDS